jgi:hypothetical protein
MHLIDHLTGLLQNCSPVSNSLKSLLALIFFRKLKQQASNLMRSMSALSAIIPRVTISFQLKLLTKKIRKKERKNGRRRKTFNICILLLFYFHSISLHTIKRLFTACLQLCFIDKLNANIVFSSVRFQRV